MRELTQYELTKISNKLETFQILEKITGVPSVALLALWGAFDDFKLKPADKSKGFYGLPMVINKDELSLKLFTFNRLTMDEVKMLMRKGPTNLVCASILIAHDLKKASKRVLYPEQAEEVVFAELKAFKSEAAELYTQIKGLL